MSHPPIEALVLRAFDFGESDRIVRLLTPDRGRITAIAKGAKRSQRRFPGTLDLFNHLRVQIARRRGAGMARLEHATLLSAYTKVRERPERFALACYLFELLDRLAPEDGARADVGQLFRFAREALRTLASLEPDGRLRVFLELRALDALGLRPELGRCVQCGAESGSAASLRFHVPDGGPLCPRCAQGREGLLSLHMGTLRALEQGLRFDLDRIDRIVLAPAALAEAMELLRRFQRYHLGIEMRSQAFLDAALPGPSGVARTG